MDKYYKAMIQDIKRNYNIEEDSSLDELIVTFRDLLEENKKQEEIIDRAISLNYEISHTIYENFLEENIVGSKYLYEKIKKQLSILEDKEV